MSGRTNGPQQNLFLNGANYSKIVGFLRTRYAKKMGLSALPEKVDEKLQKYTQHFMTEVARVQGQDKPQNALATEVIRETEISMDSWLRKQQAAQPPTTTSVGTYPRGEDVSRLFQDTSTRYENMMASRAPIPIPQVGLPDFRAPEPELDEEEDPVLLMQRETKRREDQARALGIPVAPPAPSFPSKKVESAQNGSASVMPPRLEIREEAPPSATQPIPPQADPPPPQLAPRPQDYIIPQEDVVKYRETEYNVFITSSDRNWLLNNTENRYNFSVIFNTGNTTGALGYNSAVQQRFRNIQRIEFVKAIVPIESLTALVRVPAAGSYDTSRVVNIFSLPFASVRIAELNNNSFSTNPDEDNTFAIVQYDTTWSSDLYVPQSYLPSTSAAFANVPADKTGYTGFIPKFLKTQRVYTPTPLATLNRLTIRMERHNTELISPDPDVFFINRIQLSDLITNFGGTGTTTDNTNYSSVTGTNMENPYIFIKTTNFFLFSAISEGDIINIQGCTVTPSGTFTASGAVDFTDFINKSAGHYVVATGYINVSGGNSTINLGRNNAGYCNVIIIRNRFDNPATTGGTTRNQGPSYFGGFLSQEENATSGSTAGLTSILNTAATVQTGCALINKSRQTNFVLRIITRDMDSTSNIRPDNV
jgi:hypothetical protein